MEESKECHQPMIGRGNVEKIWKAGEEGQDVYYCRVEGCSFVSSKYKTTYSHVHRIHHLKPHFYWQPKRSHQEIKRAQAGCMKRKREADASQPIGCRRSVLVPLVAELVDPKTSEPTGEGVLFGCTCIVNAGQGFEPFLVGNIGDDFRESIAVAISWAAINLPRGLAR